MMTRESPGENAYGNPPIVDSLVDVGLVGPTTGLEVPWFPAQRMIAITAQITIRLVTTTRPVPSL